MLESKRGLLSVFYVVTFAMFLVCVNLFVSKFDLKYDLTKEKLYTISDQSKEIISKLDKKIHIYVLAPEDKGNSMFRLVDQYNSKMVSVEYKDLDKDKKFVTRFQKDDEIMPNSIIVAEEDTVGNGQEQKFAGKFKIISAEELVTYDMDYQTGRSILKSVDVEPQITNAIEYIVNGDVSKIYNLVGHNERRLDPDYKKRIELANYEIEQLDLMVKRKIPDDCSILMITTPQRDWTAKEAELIDNYLKNGSALIFMDYLSENFPNMLNVINKYGFEFGHAIVVEKDIKNFVDEQGLWLIPNLVGNKITNKIIEKDYKMLLPMCQNINIKDKDNVQVLLESTKDSYGKIGTSTIEKEASDLSGPLTLAVYYEHDKTKIVAVGTTTVIDKTANDFMGGTNSDFVISAINSVSNEKASSEKNYIPPKTFDVDKVAFTRQQTYVIGFLTAIVSPLAIFLYGLFMLRRRRIR